MTYVLTIWLALTSLGSGVGHQAAPTAGAPTISRDWKRLTAADLEVIGNAPEKDLRRTLTEVETFRRTLVALLPRMNVAPAQKTLLVAMRDRGSFDRFVPRDGRGRRKQNVAGYFTVQPYASLMVLPMFADRETTFHVALHEYTHHLVSLNLRNVPTWLNEGLAEFYSTFFIDDAGRSVIGRAPGEHVETLRIQRLLPLSEFLDPGTAARLFDNELDTRRFYAQAWAFVHFMTLGDNGSRREQIARYLETLQSAPSLVDAARQAFGADLTRLDEELYNYVRRFRFPALAFELAKAGPIGAAPLQPLLEVEALHFQGRLLIDQSANDEAEEMVAKALSIEPGHLPSRLVLGRVRLHQGRKDEGMALLTQVAAQRPEDFEAHFYLAAALVDADRHEEGLKEYERAVSLNKESAAAWYGLSLAAMALKRTSQSEGAMRQAQGLYSDPSRYSSRAQFALGLGQDEAAARDVREYLKRAGWADDSAPYAAFIGAIAHWRLKQPEDADALLAEAARAARPQSWVATVVQYLQKRLEDDALLDRAKDSGQRTEAHAYIGIRAAIAGRINDARTHFLWVKERGDRNYTDTALRSQS